MNPLCLLDSKACLRETRTRTDSFQRNTIEPTLTPFPIELTWRAGTDKAQFRLRTLSSASSWTSSSLLEWTSPRLRMRRKAMSKSWKPTTLTRLGTWSSKLKNFCAKSPSRSRRKLCRPWKRMTLSNCLFVVLKTCAKKSLDAGSKLKFRLAKRWVLAPKLSLRLTNQWRQCKNHRVKCQTKLVRAARNSKKLWASLLRWPRVESSLLNSLKLTATTYSTSSWTTKELCWKSTRYSFSHQTSTSSRS